MNRFDLIRHLSATLLLLVTLTFSTLAANQANDQIVINEFLASSHALFLDPNYNQYADWIELHNTGSASVNIGGYYLSDDLSMPLKWQIPAGTSLPANGYLLVWADGLATDLHTNFKLSNNGEAIGLFDATGAVIDTLTFGKQVSDVSYGRESTSPTGWLYFEQPTPGAANSTSGLLNNDMAAKVEISLPSGFYGGAPTVTLSTPVTAAIRYTTDGSTPTRVSPEYKSPLSFNETTILKARAFEFNKLPGAVETRTFFVNENVTLPVFSLTTDPDNLFDSDKGIYLDANVATRKNWERPAVIEFFEADGSFGFKADADIRLFGRTAIYIPEKSLSIFMSNKLDYPLFSDLSLREFDSFLLRSSSDDWHRTMFRDGFIQKMIRGNMNLDTQAYRPAVLFINGEYWGIHNIREKYNESYLATHHGVDPNNLDLLYIDERQQDIEVLAGDAVHYQAMVDFAANNDLSQQANYDIIAGLVDIDNLIDYVIAEAYIGNVSWAHNIRAWRARDNGKWQWLVFDLDRGFRDSGFNALSEMANRMHPFAELLDNENFRTTFIKRFVEYINGPFAPAGVTALLDSLQEGIRAEMPSHILRWDGICGNNVCGIPDMTTWENSVNEMRNIVRSRPATVRQQLVSLFSLGSLVQLDLTLQQPGFGAVVIGEKTNITGNFSGQFVRDSEVLLRAQANGGFNFVRWQTSAQNTTTVLPRGYTWKYFDQGSLPGENWTSAGFNDTAWPSGPAQLGYGNNDEATVVSFGPNSGAKYITTYFRTTFPVASAANVQSLVFKLVRDDGAVVYLNGQEVVRSNMPTGDIVFDTRANSAIGGADEDTFFEFTVPPTALISGQNTVAVEIHQANPTSSDISFDLEIDAAMSDGAGTISTEPELALTLNNSRSLIAVFSPNSQNELPAQLRENTTLTAANSPYLALENIIVPPNVTLTLEKGAAIHFAANANLLVNGRVVANGTVDQPVNLNGLAGNRWGALCFEDATGVSTLTHAVIDGATTGPDAAHFKAAVAAWGSDVTLDFVTIKNCGQPLYANGGAIILTNSTLDGRGAGDDMINIQYAAARIENCHLFGNGELDFDSVHNGIIRNTRIDCISTDPNRDGIDIGASNNVVLENNRIYNTPDKGISVGEGALDNIIRGNLVVKAAMGVAVKDESHALIDHNTFYNTVAGVACYEKVAGQGGGHATITNSIFAGAFDAEFTVDDKSTAQMSYSLSEKSLVEGNGNVLAAAHFANVTSGDFSLLADSPAIDAGDPASPADPDGSRSDIGAFAFYQGPANVAGLFINEFMADNTNTLADEAGQFDDWIEIYNGGTEAVNLAGLYLTDDFATPALWQIPLGKADSTTIAPGGFLLVWADKDLSQGVLHADFKLSAGTEQLALVKMVGGQPVVVDSVRYGAQQPDVSWGRTSDGATNWRDFPSPTPGRTNVISQTNAGETSLLPEHFAVHQNYPNPFNPTTTIVYELPQAAHVTVEVLNLLGQRVALLVNEQKQAGVFRVDWRGIDEAGQQVSSGVYFYQVKAGSSSAIHKMMLMR